VIFLRDCVRDLRYALRQFAVKDGQLIATTIEDAVRVPSALVPGGLFVRRHYTRRPDGD
jgi:hypothetical protein